ncbi:MAG: monovalent cation/H+ antiporter subunit D [Rubrivivax sp.]|nr:monovalent cation/H+ antiporter subunit D [Rubrivivax sp.]
MEHAVIAPVVLPLMLGSLLVLMERRDATHRSRWVPALSLAGMLGLVALAVYLVGLAAESNRPLPYLVGNWAAPFGIVLVLDRLTALMLLLAALVATAALVYSLGGDAKRGPHFHSLMQFQLMGLNGAFLTGDLFNLFVFFEVLLIASYGLLLHGAGTARLKASVHYVTFNLAGSALFLIAVSLLYALTGTLNMADLAERLPRLPPDRTLLVQSAALMLLVVFGVKAAMLPLFFWLPATYGAASAPVAALFAIMTKVGVYSILRVTTLVFGTAAGAGGVGAGATVMVASPWLEALALATLALGAVGALAARHLRIVVGNLVVASAGTLILAVAIARPDTVAAGLVYLVNTTFATAALFLLADRLRQARQAQQGRRGDAGDDALVPAALGAARLPLGALFFVLAVAAAGLPPMAGFIGKALLLQAVGLTAWGGAVVAVVLASALLIMVALSLNGSTLFWRPEAAGATAGATADTTAGATAAMPPAGCRAQAAPAAIGPEDCLPSCAAHRLALALLVALLVAAALFAGPLTRYAAGTAAQLFTPQLYRQAVLSARPAPPAWDVRREKREREREGEGERGRHRERAGDQPAAPGGKP